jgi:hypothetical protein
MDNRYPVEKTTFLCYAKKPGDELKCIPPCPCRKEACEEYRAEYPYCIQMERRGRNGRLIL